MASDLGTLVVALDTLSGSAGRLEFWAAAGSLLGVILFFRGFAMLRYKRVILNTPFSKVRSASMGLVEINGIAGGLQTIPAGITGDPCYYYRAIAWQLVQDGKNRDWKRVADETLYVPFFVEDSTGHLLVDPQGAQLDVHCNFKDEISGSFFGAPAVIPPNVSQYLLRTGLSGQEGIRMEEYCIKPEYPLFVLGTLGQNPERSQQCAPQTHVPAASPSYNVSFNIFGPAANGPLGPLGRLAGIQIEAPAVEVPLNSAPSVPQSSGIAARARTSTPTPAPQPSTTWSPVSLDEEFLAAGPAGGSAKKTSAIAPPASRSLQLTAQSAIAIADTVVAPQSNGAPPTPESPDGAFDLSPAVAITKGGGNAPFTISSRSQREVVRSLAWKSALYIWGGPALTLACLYFLFSALGWM